jgi:hypothetical protein
MKYRDVIYLRDIRKDRRICSKCGHGLFGRGDFMYTVVGRGKYLCRECEKRRAALEGGQQNV